MIINVTQEHINRGCRCNLTCCGIAVAVRAVFPDLPVTVTRNWINIQADGRKYRLPTTNEVRVFIHRFDNGYEVKPFSFELKVPQELAEKSCDTASSLN